MATELDEILIKGGFQVKGYLPNRSSENEIIEQEKSKKKLLQGATQGEILGTVWNQDKDVFLFNVNPPKNLVLIKRAVFSQIARLFDPVGFVAAFLIRAQIEMQRMW